MATRHPAVAKSAATAAGQTSVPKLPEHFKALKDGIEAKDWTIRCNSSHILHTNEMEALEERLEIPAIPDMIFGHNWLQISHSGGTLKFTAEDALTHVNAHKDPGVKVKDAEHWNTSRRKAAAAAKKQKEHIEMLNKKLMENKAAAAAAGPSAAGTSESQSAMSTTTAGGESESSMSMDSVLSTAKTGDEDLQVINPYDWTYTPNKYCGVTSGEVQSEETDDKIDFEALKRPDPILFYAEIPLYEDELADSGHSLLSCKVRVMPERFLCLIRFTLRVDSVMVRINDVRCVGEIDKNELLREHTVMEAPWAELERLNLADRAFHNLESLWTSIPVKSHQTDLLKFGKAEKEDDEGKEE
eukprot:Clim_evm2s210 gene=Clim_evmTU2s210